MRKQLTKAQRIAVLKQLLKVALNWDEPRYCGFCFWLSKALNVNDLWWKALSHLTEVEALRILGIERPGYSMADGAYWFPRKDKKIRIRYIRKAIAKLKRS